MERITYINSQDYSLTFDSKGEFLLCEFTGMESAEISPATTTGYKQNGQTINDVVLGVRVMTIQILLSGDVYKKKRELDKLFNPLYGEGTLIY